MGMGAGPSQADILKVNLAQARGERTTLEGRIRTTSASITTLETALEKTKGAQTSEEIAAVLVIALVTTNLTQLKANLEEGMGRIEYLDKSIKTMEVHQSGLITNPGMTLRRPGRG